MHGYLYTSYISTSTYADSRRIIKTYRVGTEAGFEHYCSIFDGFLLAIRFRAARGVKIARLDLPFSNFKPQVHITVAMDIEDYQT